MEYTSNIDIEHLIELVFDDLQAGLKSLISILPLTCRTEVANLVLVTCPSIIY